LCCQESEVLVQLPQLHGSVPASLFIRDIAETAQLTKLAEDHFLTRLAVARLAGLSHFSEGSRVGSQGTERADVDQAELC